MIKRRPFLNEMISSRYLKILLLSPKNYQPKRPKSIQIELKLCIIVLRIKQKKAVQKANDKSNASNERQQQEKENKKRKKN